MFDRTRSTIASIDPDLWSVIQRPILTSAPPAPKPDTAAETTTKTEPPRAPEQIAMLR